MKVNKKIIFLLVLFSGGFYSCSHNNLTSEEKLLNVFKSELNAIVNHQDKSYVNYLNYQLMSFNRKKKDLRPIVEEVNKKFSKMTEEEKIEYQKKWSGLFQPVINKIYYEIKVLSYQDTADLTPKMMTVIKKLSDKIEKQQKSSEELNIIPKFFTMPENIENKENEK